MAKTIKITAKEYEELKAKNEKLKTEGRADIAEKIKTARGYGDLSENSEYDEAKNEQAKLEAEIKDNDFILENAVITDEVNTKFKVLDIEFGDEEEYTVVTSTKADLEKGEISDESPVGKALLGKKVGDVVTVEAPGGEYKLKILEISEE